jgi:hypothetical protein
MTGCIISGRRSVEQFTGEVEVKHTLHRFTLILIWFAVIACVSARAEQMTTQEKAALRIGEKFIAGHYADFDKRNKKLVVKDEGDHWEVTYELPEDMIGGAPVVIIDKRTMQVIRSFRTQ